MLSSRLPLGLHAALLHAPAAAAGCINLSCGNPTRWGLAPTQAELDLQPFNPAAPYQAEALGEAEARAALAKSLSSQMQSQVQEQLQSHPNGQACAAEDVVLCASTSEAFGLLFKLVANPGDAVAVGRPGYPLVQHLAEAEGLQPLPYAATFASGRWRLDFVALRQALAAGARAVVVIDPNNPTGARVCAEDWAQLAQLCNAYRALVIVDEVFAPYGWQSPASRFAPLAAFDRAVRLGGLSKALCLPQAKLSWIVLEGSAAFRNEARTGLTWLADLTLSVGGHVQAELPRLLAVLPQVQARVRARVAANLRQLQALLAPSGGPLPASQPSQKPQPHQPLQLGQLEPAEAGWYARVNLHEACFAGAPQTAGTDRLAWLERQANVQLQPASLFDIEAPNQVVASLILTPEILAQGWQRLAVVARAQG